MREACQICIRQEKHQGYWCERELLSIGEVQIRAGDFDGSLDSIRKSEYEYGRNMGLQDLAKALAATGQKERAFAVLNEIKLSGCENKSYLEDGVRLSWIEHLTSTGDLDAARTAVDRLAIPESRPAGLQRVAVGYFKKGDKQAAERHFQEAIAAATAITEEYDRAKALWEIADAQIAVGRTASAKSTIEGLAKAAGGFSDGWAKAAALREAAVRAVKLNDQQLSTRLFGQAVETRVTRNDRTADLNADNTVEMLASVAKAQADLGGINDAQKTAEVIRNSVSDPIDKRSCHGVLVDISIAQAKAGAFADAIATARSIEDHEGYTIGYGDPLSAIAQIQLEKGDRQAALATASQIQNGSSQAIAKLRIAIAYARDGDKAPAKKVARGIRLDSRHQLGRIAVIEFNYTKPDTWAYVYEPGFTMMSWQWADERAAEVGAAAMTLSLMLGEPPDVRYDVAFRDVLEQSIIRALARAHAANGNANGALTWADRVGSDKKAPENDFKATDAVECRVGALVGVAEGMLDKHDAVKAPKDKPN